MCIRSCLSSIHFLHPRFHSRLIKNCREIVQAIIHHSNNNLRFSCSSSISTSCSLQTYIATRDVPLFLVKESRRERAAYFDGRQNFLTKTRTLVASPLKAADRDDDVSPRTSACACLCCEKLRTGVCADRTTYTCRIDDLFRYADDGT